MDDLQQQRKQRSTPRDGRSAERRQQSEHTARAAKAKAERHEAEQSGLAGWISGRAGQWTLDEPDWDFFEIQKYFRNPYMDYWFRMEVEG